MDRDTYIAAIDTLERVLCERYRVPSLRGIGALGEAIASARKGNAAPILEAMQGREMYRWGAEAAAALTQLAATAQPAAVPKEAPLATEEPPAEPVAEPPPRTRKRMERS